MWHKEILSFPLLVKHFEFFFFFFELQYLHLEIVKTDFLTTTSWYEHLPCAGWGRIINIASSHGLVASPNKSAYVASKFGLVGLTKVRVHMNETQSKECIMMMLFDPASYPGHMEWGKSGLGTRLPWYVASFPGLQSQLMWWKAWFFYIMSTIILHTQQVSHTGSCPGNSRHRSHL